MKDLTLVGVGARAYINCVDKGFRGEGVKDPTPLEIHALVHSEIAEATEEVRNGKPYFYIEKGKPEGEAVEYADALIRILENFQANEWDVNEIVKAKMDYNETRSYKHGGKKL